MAMWFHHPPGEPGPAPSNGPAGKSEKGTAASDSAPIEPAVTRSAEGPRSNVSEDSETPGVSVGSTADDVVLVQTAQQVGPDAGLPVDRARADWIRPVEVGSAYQRYWNRLEEQYRDLAWRLRLVAKRVAVDGRPAGVAVVIDADGDQRVLGDTDRLVRLAWRLQCLDELAGHTWADARRRSAAEGGTLPKASGYRRDSSR